MSTLLDLDDDAIAATLAFSDPRLLCSTTMVCRRLRRLADEAWTKLDRNLEPNRREGGNTTRERVLSSYIVQNIMHTRIYGDAQYVTPTELVARDQLLYIYIQNTDLDHVYYNSFIGASDALTSQDGGSVYFPMKREHAKYELGEFVGFIAPMFFDHPFTDDHSHISSHVTEVFQHTRILIVAYDRRTLSERIIFNKDNDDSDDDEELMTTSTVPSISAVPLSDGSNCMEFRINWKQVFINRNELFSRAAAPFTRMEVGFYSQEDESFGLMIQTHSSTV